MSLVANVFKISSNSKSTACLALHNLDSAIYNSYSRADAEIGERYLGVLVILILFFC